MKSSPGALSLKGLKARELLEVLRGAGSRHADDETVAADMARGVPLNADGTVSLLVFVAWLVREAAAAGTSGLMGAGHA